MKLQEAAPSRLVYVRLDPGDDLLQGLRHAVATARIVNGAILAGVGSLSSYHFHVVSTPVNPPENAFVRGDGPFDILTVTGAVLDGRVHAHVTFSDTEVAMGGHLEEGSTVLTFAIILIADTSTGIDLTNWDRVGPSPDAPNLVIQSKAMDLSKMVRAAASQTIEKRRVQRS